MAFSPEAAKSVIRNPTNKKGTSASARPFLFAVKERLCREATQRAADVAFTEPLERPVPKLTDALAGDAEQRANFLERVLAPALEPEIQPENLRVPRGKRRQSRFDLVVEEAVHCLLLRVRHLVSDEPLDQ